MTAVTCPTTSDERPPNPLPQHSHNVGFVHGRDLRAPFFGGEVKSELGNALRLGPGDDLQALDDPLCALDTEGV